MTQTRKAAPSRVWRTVELAAVMIVSLAVGLATYMLRSRGSIPESVALPIYAAVVLVGGYLGVMIVTTMLESVVEPKLGATRTRGIMNLFQVVAGIILVALVFSIFGLNLTGVLVGAGFLGIVLGLAAQQVLGNIFAGLALLVSRPFEIGDRVTLATSSYGLMASSYAHESEVNGFTGVVQDIGLFFTRVLLDNGKPSTFPNSVVIASLVIDHTRVTLQEIRVRIDLDKRLDYTTFKSKLLEALDRHSEIDADKSTVELSDIAVATYQVIIVAWVRAGPREGVRTLVAQAALQVQKELAPPALAPGSAAIKPST